VLFAGDLHFGSKLFMRENFLKFIDYLNGNFQDNLEYKKIKYLFFVGDVVTGIGNYPNQEKDLEISDLEEQFLGLAELLGKIRKDIQIIISPGNHDGIRLMEPQPFLDEKYAWPLYEMENVLITPNPGYVNIGEKTNFSGFVVLTYHGFSYPYYANSIPYLIQKKAMNCPEEIMKYLLKNRHLAPTHTSTQYFPLEKDGLLIKEIPDIFVSAHTHKCGVAYYNNILLISISCWEEMTPYQEKFGNVPDHCKVPMFNLKTRKIKILDFEELGEEPKEKIQGVEVNGK
jgi:DNA polymerase II small subunit